jgi:hypothetical protein
MKLHFNEQLLSGGPTRTMGGKSKADLNGNGQSPTDEDEQREVGATQSGNNENLEEAFEPEQLEVAYQTYA